jgi:hypothetical protein
MIRAALLVLLILLAGCSPRAIRTPSSPVVGNRLPYIDLEGGWRLHVITPITRSGKFILQNSSSQQNGNTITLSASNDFLGYETDYYAVEPPGRQRVQIHFVTATVTKDGSTVPQMHPRIDLFTLLHGAKYVRLLYLRRESETDHDMAILASSKRELLVALTDRVQADPRACENVAHAYCSWIPAGIAVRPERQELVNGSESWVPAR